MPTKGTLGNPEVLRRLFGGPFLDLVLKINGERGEEYEEWLKKLLRDEMMPIPVALPGAGISIVKTVAVRIGGGRTTDQIVEAAKKLEGPNRPSYINPAITQVNMPSGNGKLHVVLIEWFEFDHDPSTEEIRDRCLEPGYGHSTYEDGLRFQEDHPDDQRQRPHIVIPENPYYGAVGCPRALDLWSYAGGRLLSLNDCHPADGWIRSCVFARRKYFVLGT